MCGFLYAKLKDQQNPGFFSIFKEALALMSYRGPDNIGHVQLLNNYFGHTRLSILDLSSRSNQPIDNQSNIVLFKGEIYNYKELSQEAHSDTLAVAGMIEDGTDVSNKLSGMYALLTYNKENQSVKVLRDFYGEKPVYYYCDDEIFIVSSTIKSITHILDKAFNKKLKINHSSLYEYFLCGYVREPKTIYDNILMLSSGHELSFSADWILNINNLFPNMLTNTAYDAKRHAESSLQTTDVEPGLLLSSGVDSTYLLSLLNQCADQFSVLTYKGLVPEQDESGAAIANVKRICENKKVNIHVIDNHEDLSALYARYPEILEQPTTDGMQLFNILTVSRQHNNKLKLVLLGTGGDELYGGYHSFKNFWKISLLRKFSSFKKWLPLKYQRFFKIGTAKGDRVASYYFLYRLCHKILPHIPNGVLNTLFAEFVSEMNKYGLKKLNNAQKKIMLFESFDYMRNQLLRDADNISLYCGYEARNPLLSIAPFHKKPDNKKSLKKELWNKHGITFARKKGFTFSQDEQGVFKTLHQKITEYNQKYHLISEGIMKKLSPADPTLLRKVYILLAWLNANAIESHQLQGFRI